MGNIIKISGTVIANATTNGLASIDAPNDAVITGVQAILTGEWTTPASDSVNIVGELSFLSTNQINVNDSRGSLMEISVAGAMLSTEGGHGLASTLFMGGLDIPLNAGERLHIHSFSSAANLVGILTFLLHTQVVNTARRSVRRR